ncbi:MAG: SapC family protein [Sterolibacterium sp.]|nr:SapC family protein [Sterolibacterium sp.]
MPNIQPVSVDRHAKRCWQHATGYAFAAAEAAVPLAVAELSKAVMSLPIGFIEHSGLFTAVAVLGLQPGKNLFVARDGRWVGQYIPAAFRCYPFRLAQTAEGQQVLCIDEDSGLVTDGPAGENFFNEDGQPTQAVLDIINFIARFEQGRLAMAATCAVLQKHQLICPWPITLKSEAGEQQVAGLFQIDEAALNQLPDAALLEVRQAGGLPLAQCQLLSIQHLPALGGLSAAHAKAAEQAQAAQTILAGGNLDLAFLNEGGTISFRNL